MNTCGSLGFSAEALRERAEKHAGRGDHFAAANAYQAIADLDPNNAEVGLRVGLHLVRAGKTREAARVYLSVAAVLAVSDRLEQAIRVTRRAIELDAAQIREERLRPIVRASGPEIVPVLWRAADAHLGCGRVAEARAVLRLAVGFDRHRIESCRRLLDLDLEIGDFAAAGVRLRTLADELLARGRTREYVPIAERLVALEPDDAMTLRALVRVYLRTGLVRRALPKLDALLRVDPHDRDALAALAEVHAALGQPHASITALTRFSWVARRQKADEDQVARVLHNALRWCQADRNYREAVQDLRARHRRAGRAPVQAPPPPPPTKMALGLVPILVG